MSSGNPKKHPMILVGILLFVMLVINAPAVRKEKY